MNLILGLLLTAIGVSNCFFTRPILDNDTRTENADESASDYNPYPGNWMVVSQPFDHFNESNQRTFYQWYYFIKGNYTYGQPIFILLGGQSTIQEYELTGTLAFDTARSHNGSFIYLEHRFYGFSSNDIIADNNLEYLQVRQALADIDNFIKHIRTDVLDDPDARVILIGSRYAGSLAVWYQHQYPNVVTGAWASSAPVLAEINFHSYMTIVGTMIRRIGGDSCYRRIQRGIERAELLYATSRYEMLEKEFRVCNASADSSHIRVLTVRLAYEFGTMVQYGRLNAIKSNCETLNKWPEHTALSLFLSFNENCYKINSTDIINYLAHSVRHWAFQQCSGLGWVPNSSSNEHPFGTLFPAQLFFDACKWVFGEKFSADAIKTNAEAFNDKYGGLSPNVDNTLFVNGENDPYIQLQVQQPLTSDNNTIVITILGESQLRDDMAMSGADSEDVQLAKRRIQSIIAKFLETKS